MSAKRANGHRSRTGSNGKAHTAKHNDRNFNVENADHINAELEEKNFYWKFQLDENEIKDLSFDEYEKKVYEKIFLKHLEERNERALKNNHSNRVEDIDQFRKNQRYCPEEIIWTIGNCDDPIDAKTLKKCFEEFVDWHEKNFSNVMLLDAALHADEPSASPHIHLRQLYFSTENGYKEIRQNKALREMEIERPDTSKKEGKYNNAKMSYTAMCHDKWEQIAEQNGIEVERERKEASECGLSLLALKKKTLERQIEVEEKKIFALKSEEERTSAFLAAADRRVETLNAEIGKLEMQIGQKEKQLKTMNTDFYLQTDYLRKARENQEEYANKINEWSEGYESYATKQGVEARSGL